MKQRHNLRFSTSERFERLYPPLRAFRPIHSTKNSHDRLPSSMTLMANSQRSNPGISSALDVPVMHGNKKGESALSQARIIHERFCCNRRSAAAACLRPAGSPRPLTVYCTSTPRGLRALRAGLATRLSDFVTNRHEQCGLGVTKRNGTPVPMDSAAFCSREESTTVVIRVSLSCLFGLSGLFGSFG